MAYVTIGKLVNGNAAILRDDAAKSIPTAFAYVKHKTGVDLYSRIIQAKGGAAASAGTHTDGCALDLRTRDLDTNTVLKVVAALREVGWVAHWRHTGSFANNQHIHASADTNKTSKTYYQVKATKAGYNGLGAGGFGGRDEHTKPSQWRSITEGITFAQSQLERMFDMASISESELRKIIREESGIGVHGQKLGSSGPSIGTAVQTTYNSVAQLQRDIETLKAEVAQLRK